MSCWVREAAYLKECQRSWIATSAEALTFPLSMSSQNLATTSFEHLLLVTILSTASKRPRGVSSSPFLAPATLPGPRERPSHPPSTLQAPNNHPCLPQHHQCQADLLSQYPPDRIGNFPESFLYKRSFSFQPSSFLHTYLLGLGALQKAFQMHEHPALHSAVMGV